MEQKNSLLDRLFGRTYDDLRPKAEKAANESIVIVRGSDGCDYIKYKDICVTTAADSRITADGMTILDRLEELKKRYIENYIAKKGLVDG